MRFDPVVLVTAGAGISVVLIIWTIANLVSDRKKKVYQRRMSRVQGTGSSDKQAAGENYKLRREEHASKVPFIDLMMQRYLPRPALLLKRMESAGLNFSVGEYLTLSLGVSAVFGFLTVVLLGRSIPVAVLSGLSCGILLPHMALNFLIERRLKAFTAEFPEAIDLIVRGLKSGLPVPASIRTVSEEIRPPLGTEFELISDRIRIGQSLDEALKISAERIPTPEFKFFVISLAVQRETGGNLAETLENLSDVLRKRRQMRQKIKAMSSEAKASAIILGSLPFLMFGIMMLINSDYVSTLFTDPRGMMMVGVGMGSLITGIFVMAKMVRFEI